MCQRNRLHRRAHEEHRRRLPRQFVEFGDELVGALQRRPALDRRGPLVELRKRVGVVRREALEPVVGVVGQEAVVGGQHDGLVARPAGDLLDPGVDLAVVLLRAWRTAIGALAVSVGVGVGDDDVGAQHVGNVLGKGHGADRADRAGRHDDASGRVGAVPARHREGDLDEAERPCGGEQNRQRRLQSEGQQRGACQRGQHRQQRPRVDRDDAERQTCRARRTAGADHQPQRADHAERAEQGELEHGEGQLRAVGRQVVLRGAGVGGRSADRGQQVWQPADQRDRARDHPDDREPQQWFCAAAGKRQCHRHDRHGECAVAEQQCVEQRGDAEE